MRRLGLLLALLPALAAAQPSDVALVESILAESKVAEVGGLGIARSLGWTRADGAEIGVVFREVISTDLLDAFDTAELTVLHDFMRGPANQAVLASMEGFTERMWDPSYERDLVARLTSGNQDGLADSSLAAAFTASKGEEHPEHLADYVVAAIYEYNAELATELKREGFFDEYRREMSAPEPPSIALGMAYGVRLALGDVPEAHIREAIRFNASDLGSRYHNLTENALYRLMAPMLAEHVLDAFLAPPIEDMIVEDIPLATGPPPPAAGSPEIYDIVEQQPELIGGLEALQSRIRYPAEAREAGISGRVYLQFVIDDQGRVIDPVVTRSPSDVLSQAALEAVRASRFKPGRQRGKAVWVRYSLPIGFYLN